MTGTTLREGQADLPSALSTKSYWHREPSEVLLGHRTTAELPVTADVVVVGSGIAGAFAAKSLLEESPGSKVVMLEAREACWGATGRNGGHCQPNVYMSDPSISHFELATYDHLRNLITANDIPCDWNTVAQGGVHAYYTPDLFAKAALQLADRAKTHPDLASKARLVRSAEELAALHVPGAVGAVVQENAASCWPYKLVCWVLEGLLRRFGGGDRADADETPDQGSASFNLQTITPVTHLQKLEREGNPGKKEGRSHSWIVHTPRGQVAARHVLLCTNAYTSRLLPSFADLIVPIRGQVAALLPASTTPDIARDHSYVFMGDAVPGDGGSPGFSRDDYLIQRRHCGREFILGGGRSYGLNRGVGASADDWVDPAVATHLRRTLPRTLTDDRDAGRAGGEPRPDPELEAAYEWTGIMGFSRDGCPWVGEVRGALGGGEGLWACAGFTGHGMPQAALCAKAIAADIAVDLDGRREEEGRPKARLDVPLPGSFEITEERVRRARELEEVKEMDDKDMFL